MIVDFKNEIIERRIERFQDLYPTLLKVAESRKSDILRVIVDQLKLPQDISRAQYIETELNRSARPGLALLNMLLRENCNIEPSSSKMSTLSIESQIITAVRSRTNSFLSDTIKIFNNNLRQVLNEDYVYAPPSPYLKQFPTVDSNIGPIHKVEFKDFYKNAQNVEDPSAAVAITQIVIHQTLALIIDGSIDKAHKNYLSAEEALIFRQANPAELIQHGIDSVLSFTFKTLSLLLKMCSDEESKKISRENLKFIVDEHIGFIYNISQMPLPTFIYLSSLQELTIDNKTKDQISQFFFGIDNKVINSFFNATRAYDKEFYTICYSREGIPRLDLNIKNFSPEQMVKLLNSGKAHGCPATPMIPEFVEMLGNIFVKITAPYYCD